MLDKPVNNPLGVSPSKGNQGTTQGKEKIEPTTNMLATPMSRWNGYIGKISSSTGFSMQETRENFTFPIQITPWMVTMKSPKPCTSSKGVFDTDVALATPTTANRTAA